VPPLVQLCFIIRWQFRPSRSDAIHASTSHTSPELSHCIAMCVLLLLLPWPLGAGETLVDNVLGFTLTVPDGFVSNPKLADVDRNIKHAFVLGDQGDDKLDILLLIETMGGTIGRDRLTPQDMPRGFQGKLFTTNWQGFELDAVAVPESLNGIATLTYNVNIPLKRGAILVKLFASADREEELKRLLPEVLSGLQGESNWTQSAPPRSTISSKHYGTVLLVITLVFVATGLIVLYLISRRAPKGTVLAMAAAIYMVSYAVDAGRIHELLLISGALRMLGFAGVILGIIDLLRTRKPREKLGG
jgi:hypothetical protein